MISAIVNFVQNVNPWALSVFLLVMFIGTLAVVPWLVICLPFDYFQKEVRERTNISTRFMPFQILLVILKNIIGAAIVVVGIIMLVLPGQGLLTILIGMIMINFPGKYQSERWLVSRKPVLTSVNWLRLKYGREALIIDKKS